VSRATNEDRRDLNKARDLIAGNGSFQVNHHKVMGLNRAGFHKREAHVKLRI